jgi:hemerythrin
MNPEIKRSAKEWSDRLAAGIPEIDAHHRKIFALAASLTGAGQQQGMMTSLHMLSDYVNIHFREEEELMLAEANPALAEHREQHAWFRAQLFRLLEEAKGMSLDQVAQEVGQLIDGWLYAHVLEFDREDLGCGQPADGAP